MKKSNNIILWANKKSLEKKCVIYIKKITSAKDVNKDYLDYEERKCRNLAKKNKIDVIKVFSDEMSLDLSLNLSVPREWLDQMIDFLKQMKKEWKPLDFVLVTNITRIGLDILEFFKTKQKIESFGAKIHSIDCSNVWTPKTELQQEIDLLMRVHLIKSINVDMERVKILWCINTQKHIKQS